MLRMMQHGLRQLGIANVRIGLAHESIRGSQGTVYGAVRSLPSDCQRQPCLGCSAALADSDQAMHLAIVGGCTGDQSEVPGGQATAWAAATH